MRTTRPLCSPAGINLRHLLVVVPVITALFLAIAPKANAETYEQYRYRLQYANYQKQYADWYNRTHSQQRYPSGFKLDADWPVAIRAVGTGVSVQLFPKVHPEGHLIGSIGLRLQNFLRRGVFVILIPEVGYNWVFNWDEHHLGFAGVRLGIGNNVIEGNVGLAILLGSDGIGMAGGTATTIGASLWNNIFGIEVSHIWRIDSEANNIHSLRIAISIDIIHPLVLLFQRGGGSPWFAVG